ncbi:MAG: tRNA pseudouridine(38-40) synthase TruA [Gammaproteobacteria bacterium]
MSETQRIAACIEYCGARYCGWQCQTDADTLQARVESALARVADEAIRVTAAGRTDSGVHACGQVIHFDTHARRASNAWLRGVNTHLPDDITLLWTQPVAADFHARFGARERAYRYVLLNRAVAPSYLHGRAGWHHAPLDAARMRQAAHGLLGRHDFSAFRAAGCQARSPWREVRALQIGRSGDWIWIDIRADGFLQHMVRNITGTLIRIGEHRAAPEWAAQLLAGRERARAAATAPPDGLYFVRAEYAAEFALPPPPRACRFW